MEKSIVCLRKNYTQVNIKESEMIKAYDAAIYVTLSPHEHTWTQAQQVAMAKYILYLQQRIEAIHELSGNKELKHEEK